MINTHSSSYLYIIELWVDTVCESMYSMLCVLSFYTFCKVPTVWYSAKKTLHYLKTVRVIVV